MRRLTLYLGLAAASTLQSGCLQYHAQRASRPADLPAAIVSATKHETLPLNPTLLTQRKPDKHLVAPGDVLTVYVQGILPMGTVETPVTTASFNAATGNYYPVNGALRSPAIGVPIEVNEEGQLPLPMLGVTSVSGLTTEEVASLIRSRYITEGYIQPERDRILVNLLKTRVHRVLVIREDTSSDQTHFRTSYGTNALLQRGRTDIVDLPSSENDILHALAATGGLPGGDALNEVWVLRNKSADSSIVQTSLTSPNGMEQLEQQGVATRVPLRVNPGEPLPFDPREAVLNDGDILYVPARSEYFYTAGLLPSGKVPLPRDQDIDIVEAISLSGGSVGSPGAGGISAFQGGRLGGLIPPSMAVVTRKLPNGEQVPIRINLTKAMSDPSERIIIQPDDVIFVYYTTGEMAGNVVLNFLNFNFLVRGSAL